VFAFYKGLYIKLAKTSENEKMFLDLRYNIEKCFEK
jgi:hypothetical protein